MRRVRLAPVEPETDIPEEGGVRPVKQTSESSSLYDDTLILNQFNQSLIRFKRQSLYDPFFQNWVNHIQELRKVF